MKNILKQCSKPQEAYKLDKQDINWLEDKNFKLQDEDGSFLTSPISEAELKVAMTEFEEVEACGLDEVTPQNIAGNYGGDSVARAL